MARILGMGWGITSDSSGNCIDKQLASLDIRTGGKGTRARKGTLDHRDDDVMGGSKLGWGGLRAREDDKVAPGDHFAVETRTLAYLASDPKASLQAAMRMGALVLANSWRVADETVLRMCTTRLGLVWYFGFGMDTTALA